MHRSETEDLVLCAACGSEISLAVDRAFAYTDDDALCMACALARGGHYDAARDDWSSPPDLSGLPRTP